MYIREDRAAAFAAKHYHADDVRLEFIPLRGGLRAAGVVRVRAVFHDRSGRQRSGHFVIKSIAGRQRREIAVYRRLLAGVQTQVAPRLLGAHANGAGACQMYLEWVRPFRNWPWGDPEITSLVIEQLAHLHSSGIGNMPRALAAWDYERELHASALTTLEHFEAVCRRDDSQDLRRSAPALRRVIADLAPMRRQLLAGDLRPALLHGDVHSGNVIIRDGASKTALLLDWERVRVGSPLEDLGSWLQSLAFWEPETRRRHDTLLQRYLRLRGTDLNGHLRQLYWMAAASNALAGALRYQLTVLDNDTQPPVARRNSARAVRDWLRIIRRADACWRM